MKFLEKIYGNTIHNLIDFSDEVLKNSLPRLNPSSRLMVASCLASLSGNSMTKLKSLLETFVEKIREKTNEHTAEDMFNASVTITLGTMVLLAFGGLVKLFVFFIYDPVHMLVSSISHIFVTNNDLLHFHFGDWLKDIFYMDKDKGWLAEHGLSEHEIFNTIVSLIISLGFVTYLYNNFADTVNYVYNTGKRGFNYFTNRNNDQQPQQTYPHLQNLGTGITNAAKTATKLLTI